MIEVSEYRHVLTSHWIFAIGYLLQSKSDNAPISHHQALYAQAQNEDEMLQDTTLDPLLRLQAMLLSAMYALHSESSVRIVHHIGAIMKLVSFHSLHRILNTGDEESQTKIRIWSAAYT